MTKDFTTSVITLAISSLAVGMISLMVLVFPHFFLQDEAIARSKAKPLKPLELAGRDIYMSEGCSYCHSQMVRPLEAEIMRYGKPTTEEQDIYEHPHLWGSKRTGPDLSNVGPKYSAQWHAIHLKRPQDVIPRSIMPPYPWLFHQLIDGEELAARMETLRDLGVPYTDYDIARARLDVDGRTKADALISYLLSLGRDPDSVVLGDTVESQ